MAGEFAGSISQGEFLTLQVVRSGTVQMGSVVERLLAKGLLLEKVYDSIRGLERKGLLVESGMQKRTRQGRTIHVTVLELTTAGENLFRSAAC